jgi:3-isopropylmalate/(R)-2-methylmalate dehydratase large subunit
VGSTVTEKILARASGRSKVAPGEYVEVTTRCPTVIAPHSALDKGVGLIQEWGAQVYDPTRIKIVDGHYGATASHGAAENRRWMRAWARAMAIPEENIYDLGRQGIENMIAVEHCWPLPGTCYFQGVNGHISTAGALGAFASALSYGTAAYLLTGKTWAKVPRSVKLVVQGTPQPGVCPRDISEYFLGRLGPSGAVGMVLEWTGPYVERLGMDGRFSICSQALFTGAWSAIMNPDERTLDYVKARTSEPFEPLVSDADAEYARVVEVDVSAVEPQVVPPPKRHIVKSVRELEGVPINRGFIGSDANAWLDDLRVAARILRYHKVRRDVILNVTPGTVGVLRRALDEGLIQVLIDAECVVPTPSEGMEWGANTPLADGDVCIATGQTNYPGRMGSDRAEIYLANPATVAASCIEGQIVDPRRYL